MGIIPTKEQDLEEAREFGREETYLNEMRSQIRSHLAVRRTKSFKMLKHLHLAWILPVVLRLKLSRRKILQLCIGTC